MVFNSDSDPVFKVVAADCTQLDYHPIYMSAGESYEVGMNTAPGIKADSWYEASTLPFFMTSNSAVQAMDAAVNKYYPGLVDKPRRVDRRKSTEAWASGLLLADAVKAGGLTSTGTPTSAEIVQGLGTLKDDTLEGLSPGVTFVAGKINPQDCWFIFKVVNGTPSMVNGGTPTCDAAIGTASS